MSKQYVDSAVAAKANDVSVIHLAGKETRSGTKQFAVSPAVPMPLQPTDAVNKAYVDDVVGNAATGAYVNKAGDTMTGPLLLQSERSDVRRGAYDRIVSAVIAFVVSAVIAMHDHLGLK